MLHLPRELELPRSARDITYTVYGSKSTATRVRIDSRRSRFNGERVDRLERPQRRKIENLFILSYPHERMSVIFD